MRELILQRLDKKAFWAFSLLLLLSFSYAVFRQDIRFALPPFAVMLLVAVFIDYRSLFYLLLISIPFSIEIYLPGGLSMNVLSEPLMLTLMGCFFASLLLGNRQDSNFYRHPVMLLIYGVFAWSVISSVGSVAPLKSVKYLLSKVWFMTSFLFVTYFLVRKVTDVKMVLWFFLISLLLLVASTVFRYALMGFSFAKMNAPFKPFFPNHVIYSTTVALFVPYCFYLLKLTKKNFLLRTFLKGSLLLLIFAVIVSYTRASWLALFVAAGYYVLIRFRLTLKVLLVCYAIGIGAGIYFFKDNRYLIHAPNYEKTIYNRGDIGRHLQATYSFEDVSGMERVYRWIAAVYMAGDNPVFGTGPSTFYPEYKRYTVGSFRTYVSDNPERSTTHNYFLMQMAEQGVPGLLLFLSLITYLLVLPEKLYHRTQNQQYRYVVLAAGMSLVIIVFHLLLNELLEVDKIGSFYFISIALLLRADMWIRKEQEEELI